MVLIRVSLRAANCAWPWLDIKKGNSLFGNCFAKRTLIDCCIRVDIKVRHDWAIDKDSRFLVMTINPLRRAHVNERSFVGDVDYF